MSQITDKSEEIMAAAEGCETIRELAQRLGWPIQSAALANEYLNLGLEWIKPGRPVAKHVPRELPKPKKGAKA